MARIAGINIPQNKVVSIALTYIHGIGLHSSKIICKKLDIPDYFDKPFKLDGSQPISENIEFSLPDGTRRQIQIGVRQSYMELVKDKILVKTSLDFSDE